MDEEVNPPTDAEKKPESALELNFVPTWARKPPENPYAGRADHEGRGRERSGRRDHSRGGFGRRDGQGRRGSRPGGEPRQEGGRPGGGFRRPAGGMRSGGGFSRRPRDGDRREARRDKGRRPPRESHPRLNVRVSFLPDRDRLALVVRDIQASRRAFPLIEIASRFLGREDLYLVKLELPPPAKGEERKTFVQCLECKRVFRNRANAEAHVLSDHLDKFFTVEETETEPPAGVFTCVGRCRLSGSFLGPPNYHGYNEKIQELWSSRFAHMSKAEYLGHIETVRDGALVEQWKDSLRKTTLYRLKEVSEGEEPKPLTRPEAQEWMRAGKLNPMLRESARCMVPGPQSRTFDDPSLRAAVSLAWQKENRFPFTLSLALRPAFRHMHLHLFKVNAKETYVTAVAPVPLDLAAAPDIEKEIVTFLEARPGSTRQQVLEGLRAGADPESGEAAELLLHLGNLTANGGVIEFFNGTLALPRRRPAPKADAVTPAPEGKEETLAMPAKDVPPPAEAPQDATPDPGESAPAVAAPASAPAPEPESRSLAEGSPEPATAGHVPEAPPTEKEPAKPE